MISKSPRKTEVIQADRLCNEVELVLFIRCQLPNNQIVKNQFQGMWGSLTSPRDAAREQPVDAKSRLAATGWSQARAKDNEVEIFRQPSLVKFFELWLKSSRSFVSLGGTQVFSCFVFVRKEGKDDS